MKRFLVFLLAAAFVMAAGNAFGVQPPFTPQGTEVDVWYWDDVAGVWVPQNFGTPEANDARLYTYINTPDGEMPQGNCNKKEWLINLKITASIAQWIDWHITWNEWNWYVRKPGIYGGNCIQACIASNGDIKIDYEGFDNLQPAIPGNNPIPVWYAHDGDGNPMVNPAALWSTPAELNANDDYLLDAELGDLLHDGICWKLYNKIEVVECNSACEYSNEPTITLTLNNQKDWIEWVDGGWWETIPAP